MTKNREQKVEILLVAPFPPPYGGISHWTKLVTSYSKEHPDRIQLQLIDTAPRHRTVFQLNFTKRIVYSLPSTIQCSLRYIRKVFSPQIKAVHITTSGQYALVRDILFMQIARLARKPCILHIRIGRTPEILKTQSSEGFLLKKAFRLADRIIAIDGSTFQSVKSVAPEPKVKQIPNCIDLNNVPASGLSRKKKVIVFAGWVIKSKGIEDLLEAWKQAYSPDWTLKIVGPYHDEYVSQLRQHFHMEGVEFLGPKENADLIELLAKTEIFCLPSHTEGFPNVVLEAMATRCAIVATRVGAIPEMLTPDCGYLVESNAPVMLAEKLASLINSSEKRRLLAENARRKVSLCYSLPTIYQAYEALWVETTSPRN